MFGRVRGRLRDMSSSDGMFGRVRGRLRDMPSSDGMFGRVRGSLRQKPSIDGMFEHEHEHEHERAAHKPSSDETFKLPRPERRHGPSHPLLCYFFTC